jgi:protein TonB
MKNKMILAVMATAVLFTACKNDRGNDNHYDTTTVSAQVTATPDNTRVATPADSLTTTTTPADTSSSNATAATAKKEPASTVETRTKKTSRKGRAILASLKPLDINKMEADKEGVYNRAEIMPSYPGGENALRKYIENNIEYPQLAMDNEAEGTVKLYFSVDEQGRISNPTVISSRIGYGLEEEALRVVKQMPRWTAGQIKGKNVKTRFTLPITYQLQ